MQSPPSGQVTSGGSNPLSVAVDLTGLSPGTYTGTITFVDPAAANTGAQVTVYLTVNSPLAPGDPGITAPLPDPVLSDWPPVVPLNGTLSIGNASAYSNVSFVWTVATRVTAQAQSYPPQSTAATADSASQKTSSPSLGLGVWSLSPGPYTLSVYAVDNANGRISKTVSKDITLVGSDLSAVRVYPNPWREDKHAAKAVTFDRLPLGATIKLFTVSSHLVKTISPQPSAQSTAIWDLTNDSKNKVASGIYVYLITDGQGNKIRGKLAIMK